MTDTTSPNCRICGHRALTPILSLGSTPLANALLTEAQLSEPEARYPLDLVFCPVCTLVQITHTVPPERLFREYLYFSSYSQTMLEHVQSLARRLIQQRGLNEGSLVVEIASNDGYLLQFYKQAGVGVLGIEPARNIAEVARGKGIETVDEFFNADLADRLLAEGKRADLIHAHNVLAHVADLQGVVAGFARLLNDGGAAVIEAPYVVDMIDHVEFDTIYHEHLCYFSLHALVALFRRHGMAVVDVRRELIHGGSLQVLAQRHHDAAPPSPAAMELLRSEEARGVTKADFYHDFADRVRHLGTDLVSLMRKLKREGRTIAAYGASAKGSTLLNCFGVGADLLDFVVDRSPHKQGRFTPGTHLPILPPEALAERRPDYTLLLTWNFRDEILAQQAAYREAGGKFIVPIPRVEVV